ncbi:fructose-specific PTS transporter subunit EIIC [Enorma phocaeensis]|uniref:Fructose-specific PTS transporter subunit EIIC n=1 Tax=Enorma phocaeensis TaxID=1871019 RepID=A0ABT7V7L6_9ACTN|nr:fructose-specific PTS transporter subunit EIIC [Enorma phocaeensis]MDM8274473.1 fructose-specific PTS transporter subunit EIIC [Enorma phocaeensis]
MERPCGGGQDRGPRLVALQAPDERRLPHASVRGGRRHPHGHLVPARPGWHGHELVRHLDPGRGPFNKAAYVFGTAMLADGSTSGQIIMASVMVGGMVPPLAIALSTTFFKNRWSAADRKAGIVNYIMGLSFITEGAIPYAAADPGRVLPSCIVGSAIAGAISAGFGCTSPAPHGGAWVIAVIGNPVMYLVALAAGAVVAALALSFLKKPLAPEESGLAK